MWPERPGSAVSAAAIIASPSVRLRSSYSREKRQRLPILAALGGEPLARLGVGQQLDDADGRMARRRGARIDAGENFDADALVAEHEVGRPAVGDVIDARGGP